MKKRIASFALAALTAFLICISASAAITSDYSNSQERVVSCDDMVKFSEETYRLDDEWSVTVIGFSESGKVPNEILSRSAGSGSDHYRYYCKFVKHIKDIQIDWLEMWVWGTFTWNTANDTVYVTNYGSDYNVLLHSFPTIVSDTGTVHKDNQGATFLFGNRCGIVSRTIVMHNGSGLNQTFTLSVDVNVKGKVNHSPSDAIEK